MMKKKKIGIIAGIFVRILLPVFLLQAGVSGCHYPAENKGKDLSHPPLTPYWALGHIVWEDAINTCHAAESLLQAYEDHQIPVDGIIIDSPWEQYYNDFRWDTLRYPHPEEMLRTFVAKRVHPLLWMTGNVNRTAVDIPGQQSPDLSYVLDKGYAIRVNGSPFFPWWKGEGVFIDFTNPEASAWWDKVMDRAFGKYVYGWKVDNMRLPEGTDSLECSAGVLAERDFKKYYYNHIYDYTVRRKSDGIIFARPYSYQGGYNATVPKLSVGWCGDYSGDWEGLRHQIRDIYISAQAGYGALACEIGGFSGAVSSRKEFIRYAQFATMVATMDNGGSNGAFTTHLPWYYDTLTSHIYRDLVTMHRALRPYIFSVLAESHLGKGNLINSTLPQQESHLLGTDLFVKAITGDNDTVSFVLPDEGKWYDWWTGEEFRGGDSITKYYPLDRFPLFIREGAVIPFDMSDVADATDPCYREDIILLLYAPTERKLDYHRPLGEGTDYENITVSCDKGEITLTASAERSFLLIVKRAGEPVNNLFSRRFLDEICNNARKYKRKGKKVIFQISDM